MYQTKKYFNNNKSNSKNIRVNHKPKNIRVNHKPSNNYATSAIYIAPKASDLPIPEFNINLNNYTHKIDNNEKYIYLIRENNIKYDESLEP